MSTLERLNLRSKDVQKFSSLWKNCWKGTKNFFRIKFLSGNKEIFEQLIYSLQSHQKTGKMSALRKDWNLIIDTCDLQAPRGHCNRKQAWFCSKQLQGLRNTFTNYCTVNTVHQTLIKALLHKEKVMCEQCTHFLSRSKFILKWTEAKCKTVLYKHELKRSGGAEVSLWLGGCRFKPPVISTCEWEPTLVSTPIFSLGRSRRKPSAPCKRLRYLGGRCFVKKAIQCKYNCQTFMFLGCWFS